MYAAIYAFLRNGVASSLLFAASSESLYGLLCVVLSEAEQDKGENGAKIRRPSLRVLTVQARPARGQDRELRADVVDLI